MQFTAERDALASVFPALRLVVPSKTVIPILNHVRVFAGDGRITLMTHNLDQCVSAEVAADVTEGGSACLPFTALNGLILGSAKGSHVKVTTTDAATVSIGRSRYQLGILPASDFPPLFSCGQSKFTFDMNVLRELVETTSYAVNPDDTRPFYANVALDGLDKPLTAIGANGVVVAVTRHSEPAPFGRILVNPIVMKHILSLTDGDAEFCIGDTLSVTAENVTYAAKLSVGDFGAYERMIANVPASYAILDQTELLLALKRLRVLTDNDKIARGIKISWDDTGTVRLKVRAGDQATQLGEEELEGSCSGSVEFACNIRYLYDAVDHLPGPTVKICASDPGSPIHILAPSDDSKHTVIMPMRW